MKNFSTIFVITLAFSVLACQPRHLDKKLVSADLRTRTTALFKLKQLSPENKKKLIPPLITYLKDQDSRIANRAADALIAMGPFAVEPLTEILKDPDVYVRLSAAYALGRIGSYAKAASPHLLEALKDPHPLIREEVAHALGETGNTDPSVINGLLLIIKEEKITDVKTAARESLIKLGHPLNSPVKKVS
jgi:HEAT repeat protein